MWIQIDPENKTAFKIGVQPSDCDLIRKIDGLLVLKTKPSTHWRGAGLGRAYDAVEFEVYKIIQDDVVDANVPHRVKVDGMWPSAHWPARNTKAAAREARRLT